MTPVTVVVDGLFGVVVVLVPPSARNCCRLNGSGVFEFAQLDDMVAYTPPRSPESLPVKHCTAL